MNLHMVDAKTCHKIEIKIAKREELVYFVLSVEAAVFHPTL